jgi:hypothetical protein
MVRDIGSECVVTGECYLMKSSLNTAKAPVCSSEAFSFGSSGMG